MDLIKVAQGRAAPTKRAHASLVALALSYMTVGASIALGMPSPKIEVAPPTMRKIAQNDPQIFRVRVAQQRGREFTVTGTNVSVATLKRSDGFAAYRIQKSPASSGIVWSISDRDSKKPLLTLSGSAFAISGTGLRMNLKPVPDQISIESRSSASSDVIASLDLETYLKGVLPAEMPASWPLEALKAQAVAARTFAIFRRDQRLNQESTGESDGRDFDLESDVMDQMFRSPLKEDQPLLAIVDRAIEETKGEILEDRRQNAFATYFHADCGGQTEEARDVWGKGEKLGTAKDASCPLNPRASWTLKLSVSQVSQLLAKAKGVGGLQIVSLRTVERTTSGRASAMSIAWSDGKTTLINGNEFRRALGFDQLKSTHFALSHVGSDYIFKGQGYGHGVGLCQWGARQLAKSGRGYQEILNHYYPKARLIGRAERLDRELDRQENLDDKERNRTDHKQVAQFH